MTVDSTIPPNGVPQETKPQQNEGVAQYTDGYSYEVPRPFLTLAQAAAILGKSIRTIERTLTGKWGAKLPEGWVARKLRTQQGDEWRILPPPGFRVKMAASNGGNGNGTAGGGGTEYDTEAITESYEMTAPNPNDFIVPAPRKRPQFRPERHSMEQPAIVIDRSEEVEHLLRQLVETQRALSEERRVHMEDLRTIYQLQSSMRLLQADADDTRKLKQELDTAKAELSDWKDRLNRELSAPWWRRLFRKQL